jgi:protein-S-isoprenylcysteine O-methyltransferase Ste14
VAASVGNSVALQVTLAGWVAFELVLRVRERAQGRGGAAADRATRALIAIALAAAFALAALTESWAKAPRIGGPYRAGGLIVIWLGLGIRVWAVGALGRAFRTTVEVDAGQAVVSSGPYRWVRHPSYSGLLLIVGGFGLAVGNWPALAICVVLPLAALVRRISVEEAELTRVLGDRYRAYQAHTKRLIPGLW